MDAPCSCFSLFPGYLHLGPLILGLLVLGRIAAACWSNVLQKRAINDARALGKPPKALEMLLAIWTLMTIALAPCWILAIAADFAAVAEQAIDSHDTDAQDNLAFWGWMTLACTLEVPGNYLLLRSIQRTDLSIFGPLNSYKPVVGLLLGWWILSEAPTAFGAVGMAIVLLGSLLLADRSQSASVGRSRAYLGMNQPGVRDRLIAVALTAAGSIFLKLAMQHRDSLTSLAAWSLLSWLLALGWLLVVGWLQGDRSSTKINFLRIALQRDLIGIAASTLAMQGLTILVFQAMNVGYALALFQLGSLVSVYLGHRLFGEVDFYYRLAAASIMFVGAVVIMLAG